MTIKMIIIQIDGIPIDLAEPSQWLKAIKRGQLQRTTMTEVDRVGVSSLERVQAQNVPELKLLFDALDPRPELAPPPPSPEEADAPAEAEPEALPVMLDKAEEQVPDQAPTDAPADGAVTPAAPGFPPPPPDAQTLDLSEPHYPPVPPPIRPPSPWKPVLIGGGALFLVSVVVAGANRRDGYPRDSGSLSSYVNTTSTTTNTMAVNMATAPPVEDMAANVMLENTMVNSSMSNSAFDNSMQSGNATTYTNDTNMTATNTVAPAANYGRQFFLINRCHESVNIWVEFRDPSSGQFVRRIFYGITSGASANMFTDNSEFYFSAMSDNFHWGSSEGGGYERMKRYFAAINAREQYYYTLSCSTGGGL